MRMTDPMIGLDCGKLAPTFSQRLAASLAPLAFLFRTFRNRTEINGLTDLDDNQLKDIGLSRADIHTALLTSTFFEDPSEHLTRSARNRRRLTVFRSSRD